MTALKTQQLHIKIAGKTVCQGLDLEIAPGELWGILGQNGSGKTTLLHTLGGLLAPQAGEIYLAGKKLSVYSAKKRAQLVGLLFQENQAVFPQTVWEYCLAGRYPHFVSFLESPQDKLAAQQALKTLQLDQQLSQNILSLSGGEWRRLALAALLTQDPAIYLLDEPLNHLDWGHQRQLLQYFQQQTRAKKIIVLMALHDINIAERYCDRVLMLMGEGEIKAGATADLLTKENLMALYKHPVSLERGSNRRWWVME